MQTRVEVFEQIFYVFLGLGTLVGVVVVTYTLYNAYKYRSSAQKERADGGDPPTLGELPTGGGKGKKLFVSFALSAIIVISMLVWTYSMLLYVEERPDQVGEDDALEIEVQGWAFGWTFIYPNGHEEQTPGGQMRVPEDTTIKVTVTSQDVWHAFGVPDMRVKADAIPGEYDETWFEASETGNHTIECFELCGDGHSQMEGELVVMEEEEFNEWYENTNGSSNETVSENETEGTDGNESESEGEGGHRISPVAPAAVGAVGGELA